MGFIVRDCHRCGAAKVQMRIRGYYASDEQDGYEMFFVRNHCKQGSTYHGYPDGELADDRDLAADRYIEESPVHVHPIVPSLSDDIPDRTRTLFAEAATCRCYGLYDAAGAMFRKSLDVGTKEFYAQDPRLKDKKPADALRSRIDALGKMLILDAEIVELADIVAVDGNFAAHDRIPYTPEAAESLEELTIDVFDRLFVRPARAARIRDKQIAAGLRPPI